MVGKRIHRWGRWSVEEDEKGKKWVRRCLLCKEKEVRRHPTVKAIHDVLVSETGIIPK